MHFTCSRLLYILLLTMGLFKQAYASEISFSQITGLSSNFVNCVAQSASGYIWVGTKNGLQRYDGYRFRQINAGNHPHGLPSLPVDQLMATQDSNVLMVRMGYRIGLLNTRTLQFRESTFEIPESFENYNIRMVTAGKQLFLVIHGREILTFNATRNRFEHNKKIINYPADWKPTSLQYDADNRLWIGGARGLGYFTTKDMRFHVPGEDSTGMQKFAPLHTIKDVTHFLIDSKERFFVTSWPLHTGYTIHLFTPGSNKLRKIPTEPNSGSNYHDLSNFTEMRGLVWAYGIDIFNTFEKDTNAFEVFYSPDNADHGIKVTQVLQMFEDREHNMWVATDNGLYLMSIIPDHVRNVVTSFLFGKAPVTHISAFGAGNILLSSWGAGVESLSYNTSLEISKGDISKEAIYAHAPQNDNAFNLVWAIGEDRSTGNVWLGCQAGHIIKHNVKKQHSEFLTPTVFNGQTIRSVLAAGPADIWFGTHGGRLVQWKNGQFHLIDTVNVAISRILKGPSGKMYLATVGNGVYEWDVESKQFTNHFIYRRDDKGLTSNRIADIAFIAADLLAVAGASGLDIVNTVTGKIQQFHTGNGLPHGVVTTLMADDNDMLWMGTTGGICRYQHATGEFKTFGKISGFVHTSGLNNLMTFSAKLPGGKLAFGGENGVVIFYPHQLNQQVLPPKPTITDFRLFNNYLPMDSIEQLGKINLKYHQNFISISFAPLTYSNANNLKFFYQLEGAGEKWIRSENGLTAIFASLPPGKYTFLVRSQNAQGRYSPITRLPIHISPAFYQSWWFLSLLAMAFAATIYLIYRARLNRLLEVYQLREKVARDLHDDVGSTLTSINVLSELARIQVSEQNHPARQYLDRISQNSTEMMESMDDIVWSIKPDNDQLVKITARMREYTANVLEPQQIHYSFETDDQLINIKLTMERRRNFFLIFKESLNNITKYAQATQVNIAITCNRSEMILNIADNGIGFNANDPVNGNGLMNMRKRAELLGGTITIQSQPGQGTGIRLSVPV